MSTGVPTTAAVLDSFLAARRRAVSARTLARDREVIACLRDSIEAYAPHFLPEAIAERFAAHARHGLEVAQLVDAYALVDAVPEFLEVWLPMHRRDAQRRTPVAKVALRQLVRWMDRHSVIDPFSCIYLLGYLDGVRGSARVPPNLAAFIRATGRPGGRGARE